jgi:hypothetical protein
LKKNKAQHKSSDPNAKPTHVDNASTHSNVSATSADTNFTRDDAQSLFTSLTKSFVEKMDNQNALIMNMTTRQDEKFEKMVIAFQALATPTKKKKKSKKSEKKSRQNISQVKAQQQQANHTAMENVQPMSTDDVQRPMVMTHASTHQTHATPLSDHTELGTAPESEASASESSSESESESEPDSQMSASTADTYTIYDENNMCRTAEENNNLLHSPTERDPARLTPATTEKNTNSPPSQTG